MYKWNRTHREKRAVANFNQTVQTMLPIGEFHTNRKIGGLVRAIPPFAKLLESLI